MGVAKAGGTAAQAPFPRPLIASPVSGAKGAGRLYQPATADGYVRSCQQLLVTAAAVWHNWQLTTTSLRSPIAYDH